MHAPPTTAQQPERGATLILGAVLGLILAGVAALAVGGWQVWRIQAATISGAVTVPADSAAPVVITSAQPNAAPDTVATPAPPNPYPGYTSSYGGEGSAYSQEPTTNPE